MNTQRDRVLAASRSFRGVTAVDFQLPDVCDGGPPILRVAARLYELDQEGYVFEHLGKRDKCKCFRLVSEPEEVERNVSERRPIGAPEAGLPSRNNQAGADVPLSLFDGIERRKGEHGWADQDEAA